MRSARPRLECVATVRAAYSAQIFAVRPFFFLQFYKHSIGLALELASVLFYTPPPARGVGRARSLGRLRELQGTGEDEIRRIAFSRGLTNALWNDEWDSLAVWSAGLPEASVTTGSPAVDGLRQATCSSKMEV